MHIFLGIYLEDSQLFVVEKLCLNVNFTLMKNVDPLFSQGLEEYLIGRVDLSGELISDFPLEISGPMRKEKNTGLEKLYFVIHGHIFSDFLPHFFEESFLLKTELIDHLVVDDLIRHFF